jgi:cytochrome d ubiquinol oxidase subunit II
MFVMHGAIYLHLKTTGPLHQRVYHWMWRGYYFFLAMYAIVTGATLAFVPRATDPFRDYPVAGLIVLVNLIAVASIPYALKRRSSGWAFVASCLTVCAFILLLGLTLFPNLVASSTDPTYSLSIYNAASSQKTLGIMLIIACLGMPFVIAYTSIIYWVFRGRVSGTEYGH